MEKDKITTIIKAKQQKLSPGISILSPEDNIPADIQSQWLIRLLSAVYINHGITRNAAKLSRDISDSKCRIWFGLENGRPLASAAQISQSDGSIEIGRAVSLTNGVGGLLMLLAALDHITSSGSPIVAEVRVSDEFTGVPSGKATQVICFRHLGLLPHAMVPAFNHGRPSRQEFFLFSSSRGISKSEPIFLPPDPKVVRFMSATALALARKRFISDLRIGHSLNHRASPSWEIVTNSPFAVISAQTSPGPSLETTLAKAESGNSFSLIPIETAPAATPAIISCLNSGFVPCGFDQSLGPSGHPVLLFGRLREGTLLAPVKVLDGGIETSEKQAADRIDQAFRRSLNQ